MNIFTDLHQESILGVIEGFDRVIFKGHLNSMFPKGAFGYYLHQRGVLLKDAKPFFEQETARIVDHAKQSAAEAGRPYIYLELVLSLSKHPPIPTPVVSRKKVWRVFRRGRPADRKIQPFRTCAELVEVWATFLQRQAVMVNPPAGRYCPSWLR